MALRVRETHELWPWFADTGNFTTYWAQANILYNGYWYAPAPSTADYLEWDINTVAAAHDVVAIAETAAAYGEGNLKFDGSTIDTFSLQSGSTTQNVKVSMAGELGKGKMRMAFETTAGFGTITQIRAVRS